MYARVLSGAISSVIDALNCAHRPDSRPSIDTGTLAVSMMWVERNQGVSRRVHRPGQWCGFEHPQYGTIVLTATLASIGTAGVPGAGLIMLSLVLASVGLPLEGVAIIAGIDRILDMARTALNVAGDCAVATVVARSEGEIDQAIYETPHVLRADGSLAPQEASPAAVPRQVSA